MAGRQSNEGTPPKKPTEESAITDPVGDGSVDSLTEFKKDWMRPFLDGLRSHGTVYAACRLAKISRQTAYNYRKSDEAFASAWDDADEECTDAVEDTIVQKALGGHVLAAIFVLKGRRPEKYRDNFDVGKIIAALNKQPKATGPDVDNLVA